MSDNREFKDRIRQGRGFFPGVPLHVSDSVGDGAIAGANVMFSRYSEVRSWRGFSPLNSKGAKLLHNVGGTIGGNSTGNVWKQAGNAIFFIGTGETFADNDFTQSIGTSSSQLQVRINGKTYQASLPKPSPPELSIAVDALGQPIPGQVSGEVSAELTRIRTVTGAESEASEVSNVINPQSGRVRVAFPAALTDQAQDEWGLYLTGHGLGGVGPHKLYRQIPEGEIAPFAFARVAAGPGNGVLTTFGGTTTAATNSRVACIVLRPAAAVLPSYVGSSFAVTPGGSQSIRVQKPVGTVNNQYLTVMITFKASHDIVPDGTNGGTDTIAAVTGVWMNGPVPLNPGSEKIDIIQDSQTTFKWKLRSAGSYSASLPLATTTTLLGTTGIGIKWTAAATGTLEVNNHFTIDLFSLIAPDGWFPTPVEWQNNPESLIGIGIYGRIIDDTMGEFSEWTTTANSQMNALAVAWADCDTTIAPTVQSNSDFKTAATTHNVTLPSGAPTATQLVTYWFTSDGEVADFTPTAPLATITDTNLLPRFLDIDYADGDLLDVLAPRGIEGPPAGTHGFGYGVVTVIAGILDGTAIIASEPNQPEQYRLGTDTVQYLNPPEPIVRLEQSPWDGSVFIWTRNSLQTVVYSGDTLLPRTVWANTGIEGPNAACITRYGAYCHSGRRGLARYRGGTEPDTNFADPVAEYVSSWNPQNTAVGYDPTIEGVVFCNHQEMLVYFETIGAWSAPLRIDLWSAAGGTLASDARILSCLTLENRLHFVIQSGADYLNVYEIFVFDIGLGGNWYLRSVPRSGGVPDKNKTITHARLIADFSSKQDMEWYWFNSLHQQDRSLIQDNPTIEGYAVSRLYVPPSILATQKVRFEWTVTTNIGAETYATFASQTRLEKYGASPTLPVTKYNLSSKLAWRISSGNLLTWYQGATGTVKGTVQDGDVIRIEWDGTGVVRASLYRAGVIVGSPFLFAYNAASWTGWHGWKVSVKDGGNVDIGKVYKYEQTGGFRLYKNFGAERGLSNIFERTYAEDGPKTYKWEKPNKTQIVTYNVELFGSAGGQKPSVLYVDGNVPGDAHNSLKTQ